MKDSVIRMLTVVLLALPLIACEKAEEEGAAESAGKRIDEAVVQGKETVSETVEEVGGAIEETGDSIQEKTEE